ncbi:MAG: hypothetical protein R3F03_07755 [Opitutaceae bacterium]
MKTAAISLMMCASLLSGCAPKLFRYMHVVVKESPALKVVERSTESNDTQGKPLSGRKIGLPTKSVLTRSDYTIVVSTRLNYAAVVFLRVESVKRKVARLNGPHLRAIEERSGMGLEGYGYSFLVAQAQGAPLEFDVLSDDGSIIGHEKIIYSVVSRGYQWAIDTL